MAKTKKYVPNALAKAEPRLASIPVEGGARVEVGIGAAYTVSKPPRPTRVVAEATPEQYEQLYKLGYTHLVQEIEE